MVETLHDQGIEYEAVEVAAQEIDAARRAGQANEPYFDAVAEVVTKATSEGEHGIIDAFSDWLWRTARHEIIDELGTTREEFGTGMAPDKQTWRFMKAYVKKQNELPSCVRHTMKTAQRFQDLPAYHPK